MQLDPTLKCCVCVPIPTHRKLGECMVYRDGIIARDIVDLSRCIING